MHYLFHDGGDDDQNGNTPDPVTNPKDIGDEFGEKIGEHEADEGNI